MLPVFISPLSCTFWRNNNNRYLSGGPRWYSGMCWLNPLPALIMGTQGFCLYGYTSSSWAWFIYLLSSPWRRYYPWFLGKGLGVLPTIPVLHTSTPRNNKQHGPGYTKVVRLWLTPASPLSSPVWQAIFRPLCFFSDSLVGSLEDTEVWGLRDKIRDSGKGYISGRGLVGLTVSSTTC